MDVTQGEHRRRQKELGMKEGFDVGLEMSGNAAGFRDMLANMCHGGKVAMLGIPGENIAIDWNKVIFNMLTLKGIYGRRDVRDLVQDDGDDRVRTGHRAGHHPPLPLHRIRAGLRRHDIGESGKVILDWEV